MCCQKRVPTAFLSTGSADLCKVPSSLSTESVCQSSARCSLFQIIAACRGRYSSYSAQHLSCVGAPASKWLLPQCNVKVKPIYWYTSPLCHYEGEYEASALIKLVFFSLFALGPTVTTSVCFTSQHLFWLRR